VSIRTSSSSRLEEAFFHGFHQPLPGKSVSKSPRLLPGISRSQELPRQPAVSGGFLKHSFRKRLVRNRWKKASSSLEEGTCPDAHLCGTLHSLRTEYETPDISCWLWKGHTESEIGRPTNGLYKETHLENSWENRLEGYAERCSRYAL